VKGAQSDCATLPELAHTPDHNKRVSGFDWRIQSKLPASQSRGIVMTSLLASRLNRIASAFLILAGNLAAALPGHADVGLRVESRPIEAPIDAYVRVTEEDESVTGLTADDFAVTLDGQAVEEFSLTLPPSQDSAQKVSVAIVIRADAYWPSAAYVGFVDELEIGDFVSVVKYWGEPEFARIGEVWALPFTELDDGPGTEEVIAFIEDSPQPGIFGAQFLYDGLMEALSQYEAASATLPEGPKAIVTVDCCGGRRQSLSDLIARANAGSTAIFDIGRSGWNSFLTLMPALKALATTTGGIQVRVANNIAPQDALPTMGSWLKDGYRVSIPAEAIEDCDRHRLAVTVRGESTSLIFSRCDTTPEDFRFRFRDDLPVATRVRSNTVTITGIDSAVPIRVYGGEYSIGCATGFTSEPGRIAPGETVCVRHVTAASGGEMTYTALIVGAESSTFQSRTVF
jgi:hypothetical protein